MATETQGIALELEGFRNFVSNFETVEKLLSDAATTAEKTVDSFNNFSASLSNIPDKIEKITSELQNKVGFNSFTQSIDTINSTLQSFDTKIETVIKDLTEINNTPLKLDNINIPNISESIEKNVTAIDKIIAKVEQLNETNAVDFIQNLDILQVVLKDFKGVENLEKVFGKLRKTLSALTRLKDFDLIDSRIEKLVNSLSKFSNLNVGSTTSIEALAKQLPLFFESLKKLGSSKTIEAIPNIIAKIADSFVGFQRIDTFVKDLPQFVTGFGQLATVLKDLSSGKGAGRLAEILKELSPALNGLVETFTKINGGQLQQISVTFASFGNSLKDFGLGIKRVAENSSIEVAIEGIKKLVDLLDKEINLNAFVNNFEKVSIVLTNFANAIKTFTSGKGLDNLQQRIDSIVQALTKLSSLNLTAFSAQLANISPQLERFSAALKILSSAQNLNVLLNNVDALSTAIGRSSFAFQAFQFIIDKIGATIVSALGNAIKTLGLFTLELIKFSASTILTGITNLINLLISLGSALIKLPFTIIANGFQLILSAIQFLLSPITTIINLFSKLGGIFSSFGGNNVSKELNDASNSSKVFDSSIKQLENDVRSYSANSSNAVNATNSLGNSFNDSNQKLFKFVSTLEASKTAASLFGNVFQRISNSLQFVVGEAFTATASFERLKLSLTALSAKDLVQQGQFESLADASQAAQVQAKNLLGEIQKLAIESPFSVDDINQGFRLAQTFNFTSDEALNLTKRVTDFLAATGQTGEVGEGIVRALGQIRAVGKLTGEEANQLAERGINVRGILAEAFDKPTSDIVKFIEQGAVPAQVAIDAILKDLGQFDGVAAQATNSLDGIISTLIDLKNIGLREFFTGIFDAFKPFGAAIGELLRSEQVLNTLSNLGNTVRDNLLTAIQALSAPLGFIVGLFQALPSPVITIGIEIAKLAAIISGIIVTIGAFNIALSVLAPLIGIFLNPLSLTIAALGALSYILIQNQEIIEEFSNAIFSNLLPSFTSLSSFIPQIISGLTGLFNFFVNLGTTVEGLGTTLLTSFQTVFSNLNVSISSFLPSLSNIETFFITSFENITSTLSSGVNEIISFLGSSLSSFAEFGSALIESYSQGILDGLSVLANAVQQIGELISFWLAPGSPPRILPDIDDWGKAVAQEYLDGFGEADFKVIGDFNSTIESLLTSIDKDLLESIDITEITNQFADAINTFKTTGEIDTVFLDSIKQSAPQASAEIEDLARKYLQVAKDTSIAEQATKMYEQRVKELENTLSSVEETDTFAAETKQLNVLTKLLDNRFVSEEQRKAIQNKITKINAEQELRSLKKTQDATKGNLEQSQQALDDTKARISLANNLAKSEKELGTNGGNIGSNDLSERTKKAKKLKETLGTLTDTVEKLNNKPLDLGLAKLDTTPLTNFQTTFSQAKDRIQTTFDTVKERFNTLKETLSNLGITFDTVKKSVIGLATVLTGGFLLKFLIPTLPLLIEIIPSLLLFSTVIVGIIGILNGFNFDPFINSFNNLIKTLNAFGFSLPEIDSTKLKQSLSNIKDEITNFQTNLKVGNNKDLISNLFNFDTSNIGTSLGNVAKNITDIISQLFENIRNIKGPTDLFTNLFSNIDIGDTSKITKLFSNLFDFSKLNISLPNFSSLFDSIINSIPINVFKEIGRILSSVFEQISNSRASESISGFTSALGFAIVQIGKFLGAIGGILSIVTFGFFEELPELIFNALDALTGFLNFIGQFIQAFETFFTKGEFTLQSFIQLGIDLFNSLADNIGLFISGIAGFFDGLNHIIDNAIIIFGNLFGIDTKSFLENNRTLVTIIESLLTGGIIGKLFQFIKGFQLLGGSFSFLKTVLLPITAPLSAIVKGLQLLFTTISRGFKVFREIDIGFGLLINSGNKVRSIGEIFSNIFSIIKTGSPEFISITKSATLLQTAFSKLVTILKTIGTFFKNLFSTQTNSSQVVTTVQNVIDDVGLTISTGATNIGGSFGSILGQIILEGVKKIPSLISSLGNLLASTLSKLLFGKLDITTFIDEGVEFAPQITKVASSIGSTFLTTVSNFFKNTKLFSFIPLPFFALPEISTLFGNLQEEFNTFFNSITLDTNLDERILEIINSIVSFIPTLLTNITAAITTGLTLAVGGIIAGLAFLVKQVVDYFSKSENRQPIFDAIINLIKAIPTALITVGNVFFEIGKSIFDGIIKGIDDALAIVGLDPVAEKFVNDLFSKINSFITSTTETFQPLIDKFQTLINTFGTTTFPNPFTEISEFISGEQGFLTTLANIITSTQTVVETFTGINLPNFLLPIATFIEGENGFIATIGKIVTAITVVKDFFTTVTIPNIFEELMLFITGEQGFLTTIGNISLEFEKLKTFLDSFVLPFVFQTIVDAISGENGLIKLLSNLFNEFNTLQSSLTGFIIPNPFEALLNILNGEGSIIEKIATVADTFVQFVATVQASGITTLLEGIKLVLEGYKTVLDTAITAFSSFGTFLDSLGIPNPFEEIATFLSNVSELLTTLQTNITNVQTFINGIVFNNPFSVLEQAMSSINDLVQPIIDGFNELSSFFADFTIPNPFEGLEIPETVKSALKFAGISLGEETGEEIATATETTVTNELSNKDLPVTVSQTTLTNANQAGQQIGTNIAEGTTEGLNSSGQQQQEETKGFFQNWIVDPLKSAAGINSPSQVAADLIGVPIGEGILFGILQSLQQGDSSLQTGLNTLLNSFDLFKNNFLNSISDLNTQLVSSFSNIGNTLSNISFNAPTLNTQGATQTTNNITSQFVQQFTQTITAFTNFKITITNNLKELITQLDNIIKTFTKDIIDDIETFFEDILSLFEKFSDNILQLIIDLNRTILSLLQNLTETILSRIEKFFKKFIEIVKDSFSDIKNIIEESFTEIKNVFDSFFTNTLAAIDSFLNNVKAKMNQFATIMKNAATEGVNQFLIEIRTTFVNQTVEAFEIAFVKIRLNVFKEVSGLGIDLGKDIIDGIVLGIKRNAEKVENALSKVINDAIERIKQQLGIASPSKFMRYTIGQPIMEGLILGLEDNIKPVDNFINNLSNKFDKNFSFGTISSVIEQPIETLYNGVINELPNLTQKINFSYNNGLNELLNGKLEQESLNQILNKQIENNNLSQLLNNVSTTSNSILNSTSVNRSLDMSSHKIVTTTSNKQYNLHMTVTPERATKIRKNFSVMEFINS